MPKKKTKKYGKRKTISFWARPDGGVGDEVSFQGRERRVTGANRPPSGGAKYRSLRSGQFSKGDPVERWFGGRWTPTGKTKARPGTTKLPGRQESLFGRKKKEK